MLVFIKYSIKTCLLMNLLENFLEELILTINWGKKLIFIIRTHTLYSCVIKQFFRLFLIIKMLIINVNIFCSVLT